MEMFDLVLQSSTPKALVASITLETPTTDMPMPRQMSLVRQLQQDTRHGPRKLRHSNFGGMIIVQGKMGRRSVVTDLTKFGDAVSPQVEMPTPALAHHGLDRDRQCDTAS